MSHLAKIIDFKKALIAKGVTAPQVQINIVRTAYVRALYSFAARQKLENSAEIDWNRFILSYWNETTPVAGNLVMAEIRQLKNQLTSILMDLGKYTKIDIVITPVAEAEEVDFVEVPGYRELVEQLVTEAGHKFPQWKIDYLGE